MDQDSGKARRCGGVLRLGVVVVGVTAFLAAAVPGVAQLGGLPPGRVPFRSYVEESGLRNFWVLALGQDSAGFLWVGTGEGLYRYDGHRFTRFGLDEGLPSAHVVHVACGRQGEVWAGTRTGAAVWNGERFEARGPSNGLPAENVEWISVGAGGVWVAVPAGLFHSADGVRFAAAPGWPAGGASAVLALAGEPTVYAASGSRIGRRGGDGTWSFWDVSALVGRRAVESLAVDAQGRLWARTIEHLLCKEPAKEVFEDRSGKLPPGQVNRGFLSLDRDGNLLVATNRGVVRHTNGRWVSIGGIAGGYAGSWQAVIEDREGSLWVGGVGLSRLLGGGAWTSWGIGEGMPGSGVWGLHRDRGGNLWVGARGGMCVGSDIDWAVVPGTEDVRIRAIVETADGTIWAGGNAPWILRHDPRTRASVRVAEEPAGSWGGIVWDLTIDREGVIWAATEHGLWHLTPGEASPRPVREPLPGAAEGSQLLTVMEDRSGTLWAMGRHGLFRRQGGSWRQFTTADGLRDNYVAYAAVEDSGDLWIAYYEPLGLERLHFDGGALKVVERLDMRVGLHTNKVYFMGRDSFGQLWVGLGAGVDVVTAAGIRHFGTSDGLAGDDCDSHAFLAGLDGEVFVGTSVALNRYRGGRVQVSPPPPLARITAARLGGKPLKPGSPASVRRQDASFEAEVAGLSFVNEHRVELQARLVGLEPDWRAIRVHELRYAALPVGHFRFEVRARFGNGPWGEAAGVELEVTP